MVRGRGEEEGGGTYSGFDDLPELAPARLQHGLEVLQRLLRLRLRPLYRWENILRQLVHTLQCLWKLWLVCLIST